MLIYNIKIDNFSVDDILCIYRKIKYENDKKIYSLSTKRRIVKSTSENRIF